METKNSTNKSSIREIESNPFFRTYNSTIIELTNPFGGNDILEKYEIEFGTQYSLNKIQEDYFKDLYVAANPYTVNNHINISLVDKNFPELLNYQHGYNEWQLIDFALDSKFDQSNLVSIVAPIGRGKTSLIYYTYLFLRNNIPFFKNRFIPIIFNCHEFKIFFKNDNNHKVIFNILSENIFFPKIIKIINPYIRINDKDFWSYYKNFCDTFYSNEAQRIEDTLKNIEDSSIRDSLKIELSQLQSKEVKTEKFIHTALKYVRQVLNKEIIIVLDNLDLLGINVVESFIDYVERLRINSTIKIILVLRTASYNQLMQKYKGALAETVHEWAQINSEDVIKKRCNNLSLRIIKESEKTPFIVNNMNIKISDISLAIRNVTSVIIKNQDILNYFSNENLRLQMKLLRILIQSGWLPNWVYHAALSNKMNFSVEKEIPNYVLIQALVTNNYPTYYEENKFDVPGLMNIVSVNFEIIEYNFLYLMILSNLKKAYNRNVSLNYLLNILKQFFDFVDNDTIIESLFYNCIHLLLNRGLIESPETYEIESGDSIRETLKTVKISILGIYYINSLIYDYNYIINVKDEIQLPNTDFQGCVNIRKLCENDGEINYYKFTSLNLQDIIIFFKIFGEYEISVVKKFKNANKLVPYRNLFCNNLNCIYTTCMIEKTIIIFKNAKFLNKDIIEQLENLLTELKSNIKGNLKIKI